MRKYAVLAALVTVFVMALTMSPAASAAPPAAGTASLTGTVTQTSDAVAAPVGSQQVLDVANLAFTTVNGQNAVTGDIVNASGQVLDSFTAPITAAQSAGSCQILDLTLGPLHLDLLGLVVDLDQVHLEITAERGPGNLLGNLLCAVAGLLDQNAAPTSGLTQLLNRILAILGL